MLLDPNRTLKVSRFPGQALQTFCFAMSQDFSELHKLRNEGIALNRCA